MMTSQHVIALMKVWMWIHAPVHLNEFYTMFSLPIHCGPFKVRKWPSLNPQSKCPKLKQYARSHRLSSNKMTNFDISSFRRFACFHFKHPWACAFRFQPHPPDLDHATCVSNSWEGGGFSPAHALCECLFEIECTCDSNLPLELVASCSLKALWVSAPAGTP